MKRNENKVPGFDDIVFRNRNKTYGAYDLRKRYKSVASISVLGVSAFFTILIIIISSLMPKDATGRDDGTIWITATPMAKYDPNLQVEKEKPKPVLAQTKPLYQAPDIVDDTSQIKGHGLISTAGALDSLMDKPVSQIDTSYLSHPIVPEPIKSDTFFISVEEPPEFPGGPAALQKYIADNTKYPAEAIDMSLQGRVIVKFAVMSDGSVSKVNVYSGVAPLLNEEAIRVVTSMPGWKPGKQNGTPVNVWFIVPVTFRIGN
jgi:periplasmic protein TonB